MILIKSFFILEEKQFEELELLDSKLVNKFGNSFSNEIWNKKNFRYELPKKFDYSLALFDHEEIIGYVVASEKNDAIYIHRFAVCKKGYSVKFFYEILKNYKNKTIFLMVNVTNKRAIEFYKSFNFDIIIDTILIKKFIAHDLQIDKNEIVIGEDYKCYLMKRD